jgi:xanthine/CO dehydrogenase XdhC/CoxF family maturation factor
MSHQWDLLELAAAWRSEGRQVALATVVATWGSSPRPPGSQLVADDTGRFMGSVSGGCIEGEVMRHAQCEHNYYNIGAPWR